MYIMLPFLFNNLGWIPSNLWGAANEPTVVLGSKPHQFDLHCHGYSKCNNYLVVSRSRNQQRNYRSKLQSFRTWTPIWSHCYSIGSPILWTVNKIPFISYISLNMRNFSNKFIQFWILFFRYTCKAINPHGEAFTEIELKEAREPSTLQQAVTDKVTATTIQFRFVAPHDTGGLPIDSFSVEYKETTHEWDDAKRRVWPASKPGKYTWTIHSFRIQICRFNRIECMWAPKSILCSKLSPFSGETTLLLNAPWI